MNNIKLMKVIKTLPQKLFGAILAILDNFCEKITLLFPRTPLQPRKFAYMDIFQCIISYNN